MMFETIKNKVNNFELNKYLGFCKAGIVAQKCNEEFRQIHDILREE